MSKYKDDYEKVRDVIYSCKTLEQLEIARTVAVQYNKTHPDAVNNLGMILAAQEAVIREVLSKDM